MARPSEASGEAWRVGGRRAERTLSGFPCQIEIEIGASGQRLETTAAQVKRRCETTHTQALWFAKRSSAPKLLARVAWPEARTALPARFGESMVWVGGLHECRLISGQERRACRRCGSRQARVLGQQPDLGQSRSNRRPWLLRCRQIVAVPSSTRAPAWCCPCPPSPS